MKPNRSPLVLRGEAATAAAGLINQGPASCPIMSRHPSSPRIDHQNLLLPTRGKLFNFDIDT